jgi:bifunctional non-homologous end joining protein LigD
LGVLVAEKLTKVLFTNLDKVLFPELKVTKGQFVEYLIRMAPRMLPFLKDRPLVLTRYPEGATEEGFYEKNAPLGTPGWVKTVKLYSPSVKQETNYVLCNDLDTLIWLGNQAALEIHTPLSRIDQIDNPDFCLFDIDPEPPATFQEGVEVALLLHETLEKLGLEAYVKTSGKKGLHVLVPVARRYTFGETRNFVHAVGRLLSKESAVVVSEFPDTKKPSKVFVDYVQNSLGRTMVCPYSLRRTPNATVSTPIEWRDLKKTIKPAEFNIFSVPPLKEDPWKNILSNPQKLVAT